MGLSTLVSSSTKQYHGSSSEVGVGVLAAKHYSAEVLGKALEGHITERAPVAFPMSPYL